MQKTGVAPCFNKVSLLQVTYVLSGRGCHEDFLGNHGILETGDLQVLANDVFAV